MNKVIIAVGGTGQPVLHLYIQLYLLGMISDPFHAIVIDTDEINKVLRLAADYFAKLQVGSQRSEGAGSPVPTVDFIRVRSKGQSQVAVALTGYGVGDLRADHPARAFFSTDALAQDVSRGLYARPALSPVLAEDWLNDPALKLKTNTHVVVVGSLIGGTGGGLVAPLLASLGEQRKLVSDLKIRAVFFGEWFRPDPGQIERNRFLSNQLLGLRSIQEVKETLDQFAIVGISPEEMIDKREHQSEKTGTHLPWPRDETHPFWRGVVMAHDLLLDTTREEKKNFPDREVGTDQYADDRDLPLLTARARVRKRLGLASALGEKRVVERMNTDPFATLLWGRKLVRLVADFWRHTVPPGSKSKPDANFCEQLQGAIEDRWSNKDYGLSGLFPGEPGSRTFMWSLRTLDWPGFEGQPVKQQLFEGLGEPARRAAATLLFWTLRG